MHLWVGGLAKYRHEADNPDLVGIAIDLSLESTSERASAVMRHRSCLWTREPRPFQSESDL